MPINSSSRRPGSSSGVIRGGTFHTLCGKYDRKRRICANASSSLSASLSTAPLMCAWISEPPSSSLVSSSPTPHLTTGGPAINNWLDPRTITEKCDAATRAAPSPATEPMHPATTGTSPINFTSTSKAGLAGM